MIEKGKDMITIFCNSLLKRDHVFVLWVQRLLQETLQLIFQVCIAFIPGLSSCFISKNVIAYLSNIKIILVNMRSFSQNNAEPKRKMLTSKGKLLITLESLTLGTLNFSSL
jgi:hypothetical protein